MIIDTKKLQQQYNDLYLKENKSWQEKTLMILFKQNDIEKIISDIEYIQETISPS
jgi:hypothetical protein